ncbi:MAG: thiol reductant ABC exporter subunit CydC [Firmicutes bacterium]|nr:thiol reductant ABC exporter subunit CydC [Bacillota bacterium]
MRFFKLTQAYRSLVIAALILGVLTAAMNLGLQSTSSYLIAKAAQHPSTILLLWVPIVAVRFFATARAGLRYLDRYVGHDVTLRWIRDLKTALYQALEPLSTAELKAHHSGDLLTRLGSDLESLQNLLVGFAEPLAVAMLGLGLVFLVGLLLNPWLAGLLILMLLLAGLVMSGGNWHLAHLASRQLVTLRAQLTARVVELIHGRTEILALNVADTVHRDIDQVEAQLDAAKRRLSRVSGVFTGVTVLITWGGMWLLLAVGIRAVHTGHLRPLLFPVLAMIALASFELVGGLGPAFRDAGSLTEAGRRVSELLASAPHQAPGPQRTARATSVPAVQFDRVSLVMGTPSQKILHDVTWELPPRRHVALVGPNGAGKSTLVQLTAGLLLPTDGAVRIDGTATTQWDPEALRQHIAVVPQFPYVFHATLRQNLCLADPQATDAMLTQALQDAGLGSWLEQLSQGLDTPLGERGTSLSGGEMKRVALARALLKDAPVLVLDEPTEGLDPVSERAVLARLFSRARSRTVLWITHSLANLDLVDEMAVLDQGRLVDQGPVGRLRTHPLVQQLMRYQTLPS